MYCKLHVGASGLSSFFFTLAALICVCVSWLQGVLANWKIKRTLSTISMVQQPNCIFGLIYTCHKMAVATFQVQYGNLLYISFLRMLHNKSLDEK